MGKLINILKDEKSYPNQVLKQIKLLMIKNWRLAYRKSVTLAIQLTVPFFFVLGLYLIQLAVDDALSSNRLYADSKSSYSEPINSIPKCISNPSLVYNGSRGGYCITIGYAPSNVPIIEQLIDALIAENPHLDRNRDVKAFQTPAQLNNFIMLNNNITQAAYVFNQYETTPTYQFNYDIQYNGTTCSSRWSGRSNSCPPPIVELISPMQLSMDRQIFKLINNITNLNSTMNDIDIAWSTGLFAHPKTKSYNIVSDLGSIFFFASLMFQFVLMLQDMVVEKETKLKEGMKMMGLYELSYYMSWFLTYSVYIILNVLLLIASGFIMGFTFFKRNDFGTYFFLFLLFGFSIICFAFFLSSCLAKSHTATFLGFFLFILFSILQAFIPNLLYIKGKPYSIQAIFSLFSPIVFAKGLTDLASASDYGGLRWRDIYTHTDTFPLVLVYRWIILDGIMFIILGWYIDNVFPGEFGTAQPLHFFLLPSYWNGNTKKQITTFKHNDWTPTPIEDQDVRDEELKVKEIDLNEMNNVEQDLSNYSVIIKNLIKVYRNNPIFKSKKDFLAVKGLSLTMEKNQIFCLLGPNGAGKTTTISMLTGLFSPSKGDAIIYGKSIINDMSSIRKFLGVCPQHDIQWEMLTGREHLEIYSAFKNIPIDKIKEEVELRLNEFGLLEVADQRTQAYSAGEKRKLSIAIAMTGNPKIVVLDEPTTGMDEVARMKVWELIERSKKDRILILTTHSMLEAQCLSDKIGIMASGRLRCLGDNLHLKNKFGKGYKLTIFLKNNNQQQSYTSMNGLKINTTSTQSLINSNTVDRLINFILSSCQGSSLVSKSHDQITVEIPREKTDELPYLLETLEVNQSSLSIQDIDVNLPTLEDVFLKIAEDAQNEQK